jgi:hypothetical protein
MLCALWAKGSMQAADSPRHLAPRQPVCIPKVLSVTAKDFSLLGELLGREGAHAAANSPFFELQLPQTIS